MSTTDTAKPTRIATSPRRVLWTGGLDSTYRVCHLLLVEKVDVQPIYVIDTARRSTVRELRAMVKIRKLLEKRSSEGQLLPTKILLRDEYQVLSSHKRMFDSIRQRAHIGGQYLWLAGIAEAEAWQGVDLSLEKLPDGPREMEKIIFRRPHEPELSGEEEAQLFRYWNFPVIHLTKEQMLAEARSHGFEDVLRLRWFCHSPIHKKACGVCRPCQIARNDGITESAEFVPAPLRWFVRASRVVGRTSHRLRGRFRGVTEG